MTYLTIVKASLNRSVRGTSLHLRARRCVLMVLGGCCCAEPSGWNASTDSDSGWSAETDSDTAPAASQYAAVVVLVAWASEGECCCLTVLIH